MAASVPRLFPKSTIVCLGTGPSLTAADVDACRGRAPVIAINDAVRLAPWADVLYAADARWWRHHKGVPAFTGARFSVKGPNAHDAHPPDVCVLKYAGFDGLALDPSGLCLGKLGGQNSGYQAINLAVHLGASRIVLLGYDMHANDGGPSHFFGEHPSPLNSDSPYRMMAWSFESLVDPLRAIGVTVVNASRQTALTCFPRVALETALNLAPAEVA